MPNAPALATTTSADRGGTPNPGDPDSIEPEALVATSWFDSGDGEAPWTATVRFTGRRVGVDRTRQGDAFVQDEVVEGVVPGTGPVSITTWVYGLNPGEWTIDAELVRSTADRSRPAIGTRPLADSHAVHPARWSWLRWRVETAPGGPIRTRWALLAPLARTPAVVPGIYTALAVVGAIAALSLQTAILRSEGTGAGSVLGGGSALAVSLIALIAGLVGAKVWYKVLHPDESILRAGWAVDGFLVVAPVVGTIGLLLANLPIGRVFDATTPGLFFAVAIGRIGCFFTGCCAGRPTGAWWGIWSSDRRIGTRRVPAQLIESGAGWILGLATLPLAAEHLQPIHGAVFLVAFGGYAVVRQAVLRIRAERRAWSFSLPLTAGAAVAVLALVSVLSAVQIAGTPSFA